MLSDIEIANKKKVKPIIKIINDLNIKDYELFGDNKAKIESKDYQNNSNLILVTAVSPTPAGEGKTTVSIALVDALKNQLKLNAIAALRQPSLGPVFGMKGGATGGGYAQVVPMANINLHFTGDFHAITSAHNLLSAMVDNHIFHGNELDIKKVVWKRCLDINDRQLRYIVDGLKSNYLKLNTFYNKRDDGFDITAASEVMAILCLSTDLFDLKKRCGEIVVGYNSKEKPVFAKQLKAHGAMAVLLKDAIKPNLIQTLEGTPVLMHGGPFANIAHGCNSIIATKTALSLSKYVVTEAGFGADLGAEKFFDIKCRLGKLKPSVCVIVLTLKSIKYNGGLDNLEKHIYNLQNVFGIETIIAINKYSTDNKNELIKLKKTLLNKNYNVSFCNGFLQGSKGAKELAKEVQRVCKKNKSKLKFSYPLNKPVKEKIKMICKKIYGAQNIKFSKHAINSIKKIEKNRFDKLPICIAKTQFSFSDNAKTLGAPKNFTMKFNDVRINSGAKFIVGVTQNIMTMPGLPKKPNAENIDISSKKKIKGIF